MSEQVAWPPCYTSEFERRTKMFKKLQGNPKLQRQIKAYYKDHPIEFINDWCVTEDPRSGDEGMRVMPFVLFNRQKEFVQFIKECVEDQESGLVEKSRDVGASWLSVCCAIWLWLFWPNSAIGFGSQNIDKVDLLGDPSTIFHKVRLTVDWLPKFFLPAGFNRDMH